MKKAFFPLTVLLLLLFSFKSSDLNWGEWKPAEGYSNIYYRVAYDYYNKYSAEKGRPAHVWCLQIDNRNTKKVGISWAITDSDAGSGTEKDWRRNSCIEANTTIQSCLHFTNTPSGGSVVVWFKDYQDCKW